MLDIGYSFLFSVISVCFVVKLRGRVVTKKNNRRMKMNLKVARLFTIFGISIVTVLLFLNIVLVSCSKKGEDSPEVAQDWLTAVEKNTLSDYRDFIRGYPGLLVKELKPRIDACIFSEIRKRITSGKPEIIENEKSIPAVIFAKGAKVTIGSVITFGYKAFFSDPLDPLEFQGTAESTLYRSGRGVVILSDDRMYVYRMTIPENLFQ
jgi:hypothetical protein